MSSSGKNVDSDNHPTNSTSIKGVSFTTAALPPPPTFDPSSLSISAVQTTTSTPSLSTAVEVEIAAAEEEGDSSSMTLPRPPPFLLHPSITAIGHESNNNDNSNNSQTSTPGTSTGTGTLPPPPPPPPSSTEPKLRKLSANLMPRPLLPPPLRSSSVSALQNQSFSSMNILPSESEELDFNTNTDTNTNASATIVGGSVPILDGSSLPLPDADADISSATATATREKDAEETAAALLQSSASASTSVNTNTSTLNIPPALSSRPDTTLLTPMESAPNSANVVAQLSALQASGALKSNNTNNNASMSASTSTSGAGTGAGTGSSSSSSSNMLSMNTPTTVLIPPKHKMTNNDGTSTTKSLMRQQSMEMTQLKPKQDELDDTIEPTKLPRIPKRNNKSLINPNQYIHTHTHTHPPNTSNLQSQSDNATTTATTKKNTNHRKRNSFQAESSPLLSNSNHYPSSSSPHASQPQSTSPTLTVMQESIPILIVSTTSSQELIKTKNELSISELFTAIANSIGSNIGSTSDSGDNDNSMKANTASNVSNMTSAGGGIYHTTTQPGATNNTNSIRLPPLRSVNNKSIQMKWDELQFVFYNGNELDYGIGYDETDDETGGSSGKLNFFEKNEQKLNCVSLGDWSSIGIGNANDDANANGTDEDDDEDHNSEGLPVEDIEYHIQKLIQRNVHNNNNNNNNNDQDHNCNHKSQVSGKLISWTEQHENNEKVQEDPIAIQQTDNASQAYDSVISDTNHTPWLLRFRHALNTIASSSCIATPNTTSSNKEKIPYYDSMLSCPPVVLYIASSNDEYPIEALMEMKNSTIHLPNACTNGFYDYNAMRKYYLVLHDEVDGNPDFNEDNVLSQMNATFGSVKRSINVNSTPSSNNAGFRSSHMMTSANCYAVVRLNSIPVDVAKKNVWKEDPIWDRFIHNKQWPTSLAKYMKDSLKIRGSCLSSKDKASLRTFIAQMVAMSVIPSLETRIANLNVEVANAKKGVKNVFNRFWRKPRESGNLSGSTHGDTTVGGASKPKSHMNQRFQRAASLSTHVIYRYDTIESQTRLLADTLFLVKDYDAALSMYRLVKDDYKHDQNLFHTASTNEMMALCLYMRDWQNDRDKREIIHHIESAMDMYAAAADEDPLMTNLEKHRPSVATIATRCVTRLSLLLSSSPSLCEEHDMDVAKLLGNASSQETPLGAAVLLEQSSSHYFRVGMYRKFAHHILMAGHLFRSAGQEHHALRCFTASMYIYHGSDRVWTYQFDHVMSALANQLYSMKRMELSFELYAKLVANTGNGRVSVKSQQKFLETLLKISRGFESNSLNSIEKMKLNLDIDGNSKSLKDEGDEVLKCTPDACRVLEIPNINIPHIWENSIRIEKSSFSNNGDSIHFGTPSPGSEEVWQELMNSTEAELKTMSDCSKNDPKSPPPPKLLTQKVLKSIDEEHSKAMYAARSKKDSANPSSPVVWARMEPITVSFTISNPLGFLVPISSLQLVAKLKCKTTHRLYTNVEAIHIPTREGKTKNIDKKWKFNCSSEEFEVANFTRLSSLPNEENISWTTDGDNENDPFFVVTKKAVALDGSSRRAISLSLCPLVMGDLEIIGIRCKIFNEIWVYHHLSIPGPLLQNTSHNRGNRVRGESTLLKSKIECNMPNLYIQMVPRRNDSSMKIPLLQGQVSEWILRISNQGSAAANNLTLKTNVPWINILCDDEMAGDSYGDRDDKTSFCVGPSGTLMDLPIKSALPENDILNPGETVDIPVQVRTSGGGSQDFYMLFRYQLFGEEYSQAANPKVRWLRNMVSLAVYPSLTVTASLTPSYTGDNDHILSVEMTNYRSDQQNDPNIFVNKISVASKLYEVKPLITQDTVNSTQEKIGHSIGWREQVTMHYLIRPVTSMNSKCVVSDYTLGKTSFEQKDGSKVTDFSCLEYAHDKFKAALHNHKRILANMEADNEIEGQHPRSIAQIRRANAPSTLEMNEDEKGISSPSTAGAFGAVKNPHSTSLEYLCSLEENTSQINIICSWTAPGKEDLISGQHHLRQIAVRPEFKSKGCPILISAQYDTTFNHDFSSTPLHVGMKISIRNRLVKSNVEFEFSLCNQPDFDFIGSSQFQWKLKGGEELVFPLEAVIFSGGIYDLQCVKITVCNKDGSKMPYVFPLQWIVKVNTIKQ